jgi:2-phosphoglycerate kinase
MDKIILIGGAPTVGKSYFARKLGEQFRLPWISTDSIREQMRKIVTKSDYPHLFDFFDASGQDAVDYLSKHSVKEIVEDQNIESIDVWEGAKAFIETDYVWNSFIVEGIAVLPSLVALLKVEGKIVKPVFLANSDEKQVRKVIFKRGLWDDADKYPDSVKEKEVEWTIEYCKWIKEECTKYNLPVIDVSKSNSYEQIVEIIR